MIDLKNFATKEADGLATLVRITKDSFAVSYKKFDADTGLELKEEVFGGNISEIIKRKDDLQAEISEIDAFLAKIEILTPENKE